MERALTLLLNQFCDPQPEFGFLRERNVAVAQFETEGAAADTEIREGRVLRQRAVNDIMLEFGRAGSRYLDMIAGGWPRADVLELSKEYLWRDQRAERDGGRQCSSLQPMIIFCFGIQHNGFGVARINKEMP